MANALHIVAALFAAIVVPSHADEPVNYSYAWALLSKQLDGASLTSEEKTYVDYARKVSSGKTTGTDTVVAAPGVSASGREFFVDNVNGNDRASGLVDKPVRTLARAVSLLRSGDTLHLAPTSTPYRETLELLDISGTPERPITIDGHSAVITGCDAISRKDWREVSPGLYCNVRLIDQLQETNDATKLQRMFFIIDGKHERMGRTSKGRQQSLKKPEDLRPGEWTFVARGRAFYARLDGDFQTGRIEAPVRRNGVALMSLRGVRDVIIKNITVTCVLNDGFNIHGHGVRRARFENITASECGDDGFSAHEDAECVIDGFVATGNSTGVANGYNTILDARRLRLADNHAVQFLLMHSARAAVADAIFDGNRLAPPLRLQRPDNLELTLVNVRDSEGNAITLRDIPAGAKLTIDGKINK